MTALDRAFLMLVAAARDGARCPMNDQMPGRGASFSALARQGKIRVEVFVHNFRQVTILVDPWKGLATAEPPLYGGKRPKPYLVVTTAGTRRNGVLVDTGYKQRAQPSVPRNLGDAT